MGGPFGNGTPTRYDLGAAGKRERGSGRLEPIVPVAELRVLGAGPSARRRQLGDAIYATSARLLPASCCAAAGGETGIDNIGRCQHQQRRLRWPVVAMQH